MMCNVDLLLKMQKIISSLIVVTHQEEGEDYNTKTVKDYKELQNGIEGITRKFTEENRVS